MLEHQEAQAVPLQNLKHLKQRFALAARPLPKRGYPGRCNRFDITLMWGEDIPTKG